MNGIEKMGLETEIDVKDYMKRLCRAYGERSVVESGKERTKSLSKPKIRWKKVDQESLWEYLGQNTYILDFTRSELFRYAPGLYCRLREVNLLDRIYADHTGRRPKK